MPLHTRCGYIGTNLNDYFRKINTQTLFYDPNDPKYLPGSSTYIGPKKNKIDEYETYKTKID